MYEIVFYTKTDGSQPAREYMDTLSLKMRTRILKIISLLMQYGGQVHMPYSEPLDDGIFQIRAQQEGNISRVLYFFTDGRKIVLTNGFTKKTPKTPPGEIDRAKRYRADYEGKEAHRK